MKVFILIVITAWAVAEHQQVSSLGKIEGIEPSRLVIIGGVEYELGAVSLSVGEAMILCNGLGKTLVNLDEPEKNQLIREFLVAEGIGADPFWTAGSFSPGIWLWQGRGLEFNFTDWAVGEPSGTGGVYVTGDSGWGSQLSLADQKARYICENWCL